MTPTLNRAVQEGTDRGGLGDVKDDVIQEEEVVAAGVVELQRPGRCGCGSRWKVEESGDGEGRPRREGQWCLH